MRRVRNVIKEVLSEAWYTLYRYRYEYLRNDGRWDAQSREVYDRGNGAAVFMYDPDRKQVLLLRQFRMPTAVNGNPDGMLLEVCAGVLDSEDPQSEIQREILEETGYSVPEITKIGAVYTSPGAVTEIIHLYTAEYRPEFQKRSGGGNAEESEDIELVEYSYSEIITMLKQGQCRDAKTLILLQHAALFGPLNDML